MSSMDSLKGTAQRTIEQGKEKVKAAQDIRTEIDALKQGLEGMPGGLDSDIVSAIDSAREQGRDMARSDMSGVESQANQDKSQADSVKSEVQTKIGENNTAKSKLDSLKSNRFGGGMDSASHTIEANTKVGENIINETESAFNSIMNDIHQAGSGI